MSKPYQKSIDKAKEIMTLFANKRVVLVYSAPQNGKTDLCNEVAYQWIMDNPANVFLFDCGLSSTYLRNQQNKRIEDFRKVGAFGAAPLYCNQWLGRKAFHLNDSNVRKSQTSKVISEINGALDQGAEKILIIRDEADFASGDDSSNFYKLLDTINFSGDDRLYLMLVTATPAVILDGINNKSLDANTCFLEEDKGYYSLADHYKRVLVEETFDPIKDECDFDEKLNDYKNSFDGRYYVLRYTGRSKVKLINKIKTFGIEVNHYNCHDGNIADFAEDLKTPPSEPTIALIDRSYSAGATLDEKCNDNIWIWHDAPFDKNDRSSIQSAARPTGYKKPFDFPILMDLDSLALWTSMHNDFKNKTPIWRIAEKHRGQTQGNLMKKQRGKKFKFRFVGVANSQQDKIYQNAKNNGDVYVYGTSRTSTNVGLAAKCWVEAGGDKCSTTQPISLRGLTGTETGTTHIAIHYNGDTQGKVLKHDADFAGAEPNKYAGCYVIFERISQANQLVMDNKTIYSNGNVFGNAA